MASDASSLGRDLTSADTSSSTIRAVNANPRVLSGARRVARGRYNRAARAIDDR
jgi:hypothetical protein